MKSSALPVSSSYPYVELDAMGVPFLAGTTMKLAELVMARQAYGWSPEEIHFQHPALSLSQIHSALAYYWDHQGEIDRDIERRSRLSSRPGAKLAPLPWRKKPQSSRRYP
jgi:uncharacterized protein (DUF433 family)